MQSTQKVVKNILDRGIIHFIGIGGIGMSGIAEILHHMGYPVQGSDVSLNANVKRLQDLGIKVIVGQKEENVNNVAVVVKSTAIKDNNPEIKASKHKGILVIHRSEMLAQLMSLKSSISVAGTHGKTTTTSLVSALFDAANQDPTVINGGVINSYGTNAKMGSGKWLIAEADESDRSFLNLPTAIAIVTNIDPEHMENYGTFDVLKDSFVQFVNTISETGFAVLCKDHPVVCEIMYRINNRKIITYSMKTDADVRAENIRILPTESKFDVVISKNVNAGPYRLENIYLPMPGEHNVLNSLAAIAVASQLGFDKNVIINGFKGFKGVKRRFTITGEVSGITIIDDYAHHPKEILVTLNTAKNYVKETGGKVIAVVQPHRYSRVKDLFEDFCDCLKLADKILIADIYAAGEDPIDGIDKENLVKKIKETGHSDVNVLVSEDELPMVISTIAKTGDIVLCMGAGSVTLWANNLPNQLKEIL